MRMKISEERKLIASWLERQLFRIPPVENEVCHLTYDMWKDLKDTIIRGEYHEKS